MRPLLSLIRLAPDLRMGLLMGLLMLSPQASFADAKAGEVVAKNGIAGIPACMTCHGVNGEGQAAVAYPRLAGQAQAYLVKQLQDFKARRMSPVMQPYAQKLTEQQIGDVADYYSGLTSTTAPFNALPSPSHPSPSHIVAPDASAIATVSGVSATPSTAAPARGAHLAQKGNWDKGMPACFACHGENGHGIAPAFPSLAGQNAAYLSKQLSDWQSGVRSNDPQGLMKAVAEKLSRDDISAVSAYLDRLP